MAAYVWDYTEKMDLMRYFWDAAVELDPAARDLDEGRRFPLCRPDPLSALFTQAGLDEVQVQSFDISTQFHDFDDYWTSFLGAERRNSDRPLCAWGVSKHCPMSIRC